MIYRISILSVYFIFCLSTVCCADSVAQPANQEKPVGPQDTISKRPPLSNGQASGSNANQVKPAGSSDTSSQVSSSSDRSSAGNVLELPGGVQVPAVVAGAILGGTAALTAAFIGAFVAIRNSREKLRQQTATLQAQIESTRGNLERQIASTQTLKQEDIETNRRSLLMAIGVEAIDIKIRTSQYVKQIDDEYTNPTEDNIERLPPRCLRWVG